MEKLIINSSDHSDLMHDVRAKKGYLKANGERLSNVFQGKELQAGRSSGLEDIEAKQFSRELFSSLYENGQQLDNSNWASEAIKSIKQNPKFESLQTRCKNDPDYSGIVTSRFLQELCYSIAEFRDLEQDKNENPMMKNIPFEDYAESEGEEIGDDIEVACDDFFDELLDKLDQVDQAMQLSFGDSIEEPGNDGKLRLKLLKRIQKNPYLLEMLQRAGAMLAAMDTRLAVPDVKARNIRVGITQGRDLRKLTNNSKRLLLNKTTRRIFSYKFLQAELDITKFEGENPKNRGPIMVLIDESSSMGGKRNLLARSIAIAMIHLSFKENRDLTIIGFNGRVTDTHSIKSGKCYHYERLINKNELVMAIASRTPSGGTNFNAPISLALDKNPLAEKADLIMVTDGEGLISDPVMESIKEFKAKGMQFYSILLGSRPGVLESISDQIVDLEKLASNQDQDQTIGSILKSTKG